MTYLCRENQINGIINLRFILTQAFKYIKLTIPVVLYGRETLSLTPKEKQRLMSKNRLLRTVFGPKWEEVAGGWRKVYKEELHSFHSSHAACMAAMKNGCKGLFGNPEGSLGGPRPRSERFTMDLRETGWYGVGWIHLAKDVPALTIVKRV
jgi:hypothetical protein